jgi:hypothetical protein
MFPPTCDYKGGGIEKPRLNPKPHSEAEESQLVNTARFSPPKIVAVGYFVFCILSVYSSFLF